MTREEADSLQATIDSYVVLRDSTEENKRKASKVVKMQLAIFLEPFIPKSKIGGDIDIMGFISPLLSLLDIDFHAEVSGTIAVVDGCLEADPDMDEDEYDRLFCIVIPGDIMKSSLEIRSSKIMADVMMKDAEKLRPTKEEGEKT